MFHPNMKSRKNVFASHPNHGFLSNQKQAVMPTQGESRPVPPMVAAVQQLYFTP